MNKQKTKKTKQYKATAMLVLAIINAVISVGVLIACIVTLCTWQSVISIGGTMQNVEALFPFFVVLTVFAGLSIILSALAIVSRKLNKSFGLTLALGIVCIVCGLVETSIALGILTIIHATKLKKAQKLAVKK